MPYQPFEQNFGFGEQSDSKTDMSKFHAENCLVALLAATTCVKADVNTEVGTKDFDKQFGKEVGDALRRIGCESVKVDGDTVKLHLKDTYYENVNQNGLDRIRLKQDVDFKVSRDGGTIKITDINGVDLDFGKFVPWKSLPDISLSRGSASMYGISFNVPNEAYDQVDALLKKFGK